jgi:hypothetical protein
MLVLGNENKLLPTQQLAAVRLAGPQSTAQWFRWLPPSRQRLAP